MSAKRLLWLKSKNPACAAVKRKRRIGADEAAQIKALDAARAGATWQAASNDEFTDQLRIVLAELVDRNNPQSVRKMRRIAEKLAECAMNGDRWAICQVADRLDGRPAQDTSTSVAFENRRPEELTDELMAIAAGGLNARLQTAETCIKLCRFRSEADLQRAAYRTGFMSTRP
jgi:hypothetical protein